LRRRVAGTVALDYPIGRLTTYRLGGSAALYFEPQSTEDLDALGAVLRAGGVGPGELPTLILGRGSNMVISDEGWPGLILRMGDAFSWVRAADADPDGLTAGASTDLPRLVNWAARRSLSGLEFAIAIPGSVGGAVRMNAGAHGRDVASCLVSASVFDIDSWTLDAVGRDSLGFSYRRSNLTSRRIVVDATFVLQRDDSDAIRRRIEEYRRHRSQTQPGAVQNAGSVFKNPPDDSAGRLVEAAGLKGLRVGGAHVSELHANFFVADAGAAAQDVFDLVKEVQNRVSERFSVRLEPEIRFVGAFRSDGETTVEGASE
jgi:UDP-N-acetylmuramate dehydrogenase